MGMIATQIDDWIDTPANFGFCCSIALQVFDPIQNLVTLRQS